MTDTLPSRQTVLASALPAHLATATRVHPRDLQPGMALSLTGEVVTATLHVRGTRVVTAQVLDVTGETRLVRYAFERPVHLRPRTA